MTNTNTKRPLIVNVSFFRGIFPRKGRRCARVELPWGETRWVPVDGRDVVVAKSVACSQSYLPVEVLAPDALVKLQSYVWDGRMGGKFVWMRDLPAEGVVLAKNWSTYECNGPSTSSFLVPAGTRILAGAAGTPAVAGHHWQVQP